MSETIKNNQNNRFSLLILTTDFFKYLGTMIHRPNITSKSGNGQNIKKFICQRVAENGLPRVTSLLSPWFPDASVSQGSVGIEEKAIK